jgi:hypothetical protein
MVKPLEWSGPSKISQREEELRLKLLETVIVQTKDSIIITEANLNERQLPKIVYVNPATYDWILLSWNYRTISRPIKGH